MRGISPRTGVAFDRPLIARADPLVLIGIVIGFAPILSGVLFRTYGYHVSPRWAEILRQLDAPFIFVELLVVVWARRRGLSYRALSDRLDRTARFAIVIFLGSFWVSSAFFSEDHIYSLTRASFWMIHIGFGFAILHIAGIPTKAGLQRCGVTIFAGFVLFLPLAAAHLMAAPEPHLVPGGKIIWSSAIPGSLSVRHFGIWAALVLACAVGALYASDASARETRVVCGVIFLATAALFWSGTRTGVYGIVGALVILTAISRRFPPRRALGAGCAAILLGILLSEVWLPPDSAFGIIRRLLTTPSDTIDRFSSGRSLIWASMMQNFAGSPLFGVGEGATFWLAPLNGDRHVQPHNSVVQMLSSWGIIACLAAGYLLARLLAYFHRNAISDPRIIPIVLMIDCLLIMSLADGVLYFSRFVMWFAAGAALILSTASHRATESPFCRPL